MIMRSWAGLASGLGLVLALGLAGCGGGGNDEFAANGGPDAKEASVKFAQCMRDNGIPNFPDPEVDDSGHLHIDLPRGVSDSARKAAQAKCEKYLPGAPAGAADQEQIEAMRKHSQCMRENGIPGWPDPEDDGKLNVDLHELGLSGEDDPKLKAAEEKCRPLLKSVPTSGQGGTG
jgi:hypothetical protein